ncbi:hypothetical protein HV346_10785 [Enterobacter sp. RHBSTW-00994]|uniref:hypothetical protein n=1 Tax=Enterobacter sp. RHBSTW-00994 TaxID=2742676 RepID=UPI0015E9BFB0|nr:hypothetical protein [Enterobacter sp. RHBSTW-00994]QLR43133.1 hypothetical protein HV346_10785 [Enterobacter sp. RHBSTW-00994]
MHIFTPEKKAALNVHYGMDAENKNVSLRRAKKMPGWKMRIFRDEKREFGENDSGWYNAALL